MNGLTMEAPARHEGQLTEDDLVPGTRFRWEHPHIGHPMTVFTYQFTGYPRLRGGGWWIQCAYVRDDGTLELHHDLSLADAGITTYQDGSWNTNWLRKVDDG